MNKTLTFNLQKITETTLQKISQLLIEQENKIKEALTDYFGLEDTQRIQTILDTLSDEAESMKDDVHDARRKAENLYNKSDEVLSLVTDVSDDIDTVLDKLELLTGTIDKERDQLTQEAA